MRLTTMFFPLLAACMPNSDTPAPTPPATQDTCAAQDMQTLVGQPATVLETMRLKGPLRILRPGDAMTMDYSADRSNIEIDESGLIARIWCG